MKNVVIYHNPACGTSRNTLALIRNAGIEPEVIEYLHNPPTRARLLELIAAAGLTVRQVLREKAPPYEELKLSDPALTDAQLLDAMIAPSHPHQQAAGRDGSRACGYAAPPSGCWRSCRRGKVKKRRSSRRHVHLSTLHHK